MHRHAIDICPDDHAELIRHLDTLAESGAEVITVLWQPQRPNNADQTAAFDTRGSFAVISRRNTTIDAAVIDEQDERAAILT